MNKPQRKTGESGSPGGLVKRMSTSKRLILLLTVAVSVVVAATSYYTLRRREAALKATMRSEVLAHAYTLQIALEDLFKADRPADAQQLVDRLSNNPYLFRVTLFDEVGRVLMYSDLNTTGEQAKEPEVAQAIASGEKVEHLHRIGDEEYFSIVLPVQLGEGRRGAFEIAQPTAFLEADISSTRRHHAINLVIVIVIIFVIVSIALRVSLARPIKALLEGTTAIGRGDLTHRVALPVKSGEFAQLAGEFNRMADNLASQREVAAREAEQRLDLERELRHRDRLVLIGRIAASVAHEMGTPLNVIDGRAAQLLDRPDAPVEMRQRNLSIIRAQARRITRVVRQLLNLARTQEVTRQPVELAQVFNDVGELIESDAARDGVSVEIVPGPSVWVEGDCDLLHQVFLNICLNGIHAMPHGGRLRLEYKSETVSKDGQELAVAQVSDSGGGIAPEHLSQIFDPFFTTKDVGQGTGLGLAISRRIIEDHGGWIEAANRTDGKGAVFTVFLPKAQEPVQDIYAQAPLQQEA
jgi:two-component system, NtrC family, sensor kinase